MSNSLRDALVRSGVSQPQPRRKPGQRKRRKASAKADSGEMDLARAYALRARDETRERKDAERQAREKKERRRKLRKLLEGKALDREDAECLRHYEFHGKIRRAHVTAEQLQALNAGDLAVVQSRGRFLLVESGVARQAAAIEPGCLALLVDPAQAGQSDDDVPDDGVPDDLVW